MIHAKIGPEDNQRKQTTSEENVNGRNSLVEQIILL